MPEEVPDLYEVLSVARWVDQPLMDSQFRRRHAAFVQAGQPTEELESAYAILSDPASRNEYDDLLFGQDADVFEAEQEAEKRERSGGSGWSFTKIVSWGFSAFILLSIIARTCNSVRG